MSYAALTVELQNLLKLDFPPIGITRVTARPPNIPDHPNPTPSACTLWRRAEKSTFFATAEMHMGCPIGAMVMGFTLSKTKQEELMGLVGNMFTVNYLREDEVDHIPRFEGKTSGIVYGPLSEFPLDPEVVLVWANPKQAMLIEELLGDTTWGRPQPSVLGRPTCAALPSAHASNNAKLSLGCIGMRTFTEIPETHVLTVLPKNSLQNIADKLQETLAANTEMETLYRSMKSAL